MCEYLQVIFGGFLGVLLDDVLFLSMILSHLVKVWLDGVLGRFDSFLDVSEKVSVSCLSPRAVTLSFPAVMSMSILGHVADLNTRSQPKNGCSLHFADACVAQRCWWSNTRKSFHTSAGPDLKWLSCCCQWPLFREASICECRWS